MRWLTRRLYSAQTTDRRRRPFFDRARRRGVLVAAR